MKARFLILVVLATASYVLSAEAAQDMQKSNASNGKGENNSNRELKADVEISAAPNADDVDAPCCLNIF